MEHLRNLLLIITTMGALISISAKYANSFFGEIIKAKFDNFNCQETFSYTFVKWIGGLIFTFDIIGICSLIKIINKTEVKQVVESSNSTNTFTNIEKIFIISVVLIFISAFISALSLRDIRDKYIARMKNSGKSRKCKFENIVISLAMICVLISTLGFIYSMLWIIFTEITNGKPVQIISVEVFALFYGFWLLSIGLFILTRNLKTAIRKIKYTDIYTFEIKDSDEIIVGIFQELDCYYMMFKDENILFLPKNRVELLKYKKDFKQDESKGVKIYDNLNIKIKSIDKKLKDKIKKLKNIRNFKIIIWTVIYVIYFIVVRIIIKIIMISIISLYEVLISILN